MKKVAFHNLGCKVNSYELDAVIKILENDGYNVVPFSKQADVYIINTCSVTNMADRKSRQMINKARKANPEGIVIAMGCFVQGITDEQRMAINADIVIGNNEKINIVEHINSYCVQKGIDLENNLDKSNSTENKLDNKQINCIDINENDIPYEELTLTAAPSHTRVFVKVQDGCNQFCSYCIIPFTRGRVRSRDKKNVIKEITNLAKDGCKEFVLTGIHLSSYGMTDWSYNLVMAGEALNSELLELIENVDKIPGVERIRLGSLEPQIITKEFVERLVKIESFCPHFHLSLQSGSDLVLERMNRKYTTKQYKDTCVLLREYFDNPAITTDVIVGFPGETEEEFRDTVKFLEDIHFYEMHVFKYSRRRGTKADKMDNQIDEQVKTLRSNKLIELDNKMSSEYREAFVGEELEVLMEEAVEINGKRYFGGYTKEYVRVLKESDEDLSNQIVKGTAIKIIDESLLII